MNKNFGSEPTSRNTSSKSAKTIKSKKAKLGEEMEADTPEMEDYAKQNSESTSANSLSKEELIEFNKTPEAEQLVNWVRTQYGKCRDDMQSQKTVWNLNLSMYKGDQYVDRIGNNVVPVPAPKSKPRIVVNRIRPHVRTEVARLTSMEPTAEVVPASSETSDVEAARAAETLWVSCVERLNIQRKLRDAIWWASVTGIGYLKLRWNPNAKEVYPDDSVAYGDYGVSVPTPFHIMVPNQLQTDIEDQPYVFNIFAMPMDQVRAQYADFFEGDFKPTLISTSEIMDESRLNIKAAANNATADSCLVIEAWVKPGNNKYFPKGGMVTLVDEKIVHYSPNGMPYKHGQYPFIKFDNVQSGSYYATSAIDDIIPLQRELNRIRSVMVEVRNKLASPGLMFREGSIDPRRMTNEIGRLIPIKGGGDYPQPLPIPQLPPSLMEEHNQILADIEDITGQHQVSKGTSPTGVTAATAIELLQEQDNTYLSATTDSVEYGMQKFASQLIQLFTEFADSQRQIKVVGKDKSVSVKLMMGSDLKTATDIRIERGSSLPYSKAARTAQITDWMSRGLLPYEIGFDMMDLPHFDDYYDIVKVDQRQAERENLAMLSLDINKLSADRAAADNQKYMAIAQYALSNPEFGLTPEALMEDQSILDQIIEADPQAGMIAAEFERAFTQVHDFDNHEAHIEAHNRVRKSQEYETADPAIQDEFNRHVAEHEKMMQQKMMEDMFFQQGQAMDPNAMAEGQAMELGADPNADPNAESGAGNQFSGVEQPPADSTSEMAPGMSV